MVKGPQGKASDSIKCIKLWYDHLTHNRVHFPLLIGAVKPIWAHPTLYWYAFKSKSDSTPQIIKGQIWVWVIGECHRERSRKTAFYWWQALTKCTQHQIWARFDVHTHIAEVTSCTSKKHQKHSKTNQFEGAFHFWNRKHMVCMDGLALGLLYNVFVILFSSLEPIQQHQTVI